MREFQAVFTEAHSTINRKTNDTNHCLSYFMNKIKDKLRVALKQQRYTKCRNQWPILFHSFRGKLSQYSFSVHIVCILLFPLRTAFSSFSRSESLSEQSTKPSDFRCQLLFRDLFGSLFIFFSKGNVFVNLKSYHCNYISKTMNANFLLFYNVEA